MLLKIRCPVWLAGVLLACALWLCLFGIRISESVLNGATVVHPYLDIAMFLGQNNDTRSLHNAFTTKQDVFHFVPVVNMTKQERRRKMHLCHWRPHMWTPSRILKDEFGFEQVDANEDDDWDMIFGGYPHCGSKGWDWNMETGLNKRLLDGGFQLKPHQVWFPCMGCAQSFCNKRGLCKLQREVDPSSCYLLPDDKDKVVELMDANTTQLWVLKRDAPHLHMHMSSGVKMIRSKKLLPSDEEMKDETYMVQPYSEPFIGSGAYQRKSEMKMDVAITSVDPLRVYINSRPWVTISNTLYVPNATSDLHEKCMQDSHANMRYCLEFSSKELEKKDTILSFEAYSDRVGITRDQQMQIVAIAKRILKNVFKNSKLSLADNNLNRGITQSGATCFSIMRADFGIAADLSSAFLYEINEFPFANQKYAAGEIQQKAFRDLFNMIGIAEIPMQPRDRADFELAHLGGWIPLSLDDK
eukprot:scaffold6378_cov176-Amphora_coffeaeformis.AAC.16